MWFQSGGLHFYDFLMIINHWFYVGRRLRTSTLVISWSSMSDLLVVDLRAMCGLLLGVTRKLDSSHHSEGLEKTGKSSTVSKKRVLRFSVPLPK